MSRTKTWLESFAVIDELKPQIIVPGHGKVTDLATAQAQGITRSEDTLLPEEIEAARAAFIRQQAINELRAFVRRRVR